MGNDIRLAALVAMLSSLSASVAETSATTGRLSFTNQPSTRSLGGALASEQLRQSLERTDWLQAGHAATDVGDGF
jgi:hypothetical protein